MLKNIAVTIVAVVLALAGCEVALRLFDAAPPALPAVMSPNAEYDATLGWRPAEHISYRGRQTIARGIRTNGVGETDVRTGGALAVGDSFTAGSEVADGETWPAQLERLIGMPVVNAGSGGYGADQTVMRAEELLPLVQPRVLLVGMLEDDIARVGYSSRTAAKPYYTIEAGVLKLHNVPVPRTPPQEPGWTQALLSQSALVDRVATAIGRPGWSRGASNIRVRTQPVEVTCRLLQRLKARADGLGIRTLLVMQYGAQINSTFAAPTERAAQVEACASTMGIHVVDEFSTLNALFKADPAQIRSYYVMHGDTPGHMSAHGNAHIAQLIAAALAQPAVIGRADAWQPAALARTDGYNVLPPIDALWAALPYTQWLVENDPATFRLAAEGPEAEHYAVTKAAPVKPGPYTLSTEVQPSRTSCMRMQLLDPGTGRGAIADFDFRTAVAHIPVDNLGGARADVEPVREGWHRVWISAHASGTHLQAILQLADTKCGMNFRPRDEAIAIRDMRLERGQVPAHAVAGR
jgi:hypothetical protein